MTEILPIGTTPGELAEANRAESKRERIWVGEVTFSDDRTIKLQPGEILVVVGPNNSGKSRFLRELREKMTSGVRAVTSVLKSYKIVEPAVPIALLEDITKRFPPSRDGNHHIPMTGSFQPAHLQSMWAHRGTNGYEGLSGRFVQHLKTDDRLRLATAIGMIDLSTQWPEHALHKIYDDEELERKLSDVVKKSFGMDLVLNRAAGSNVFFHVGTRPEPPPGKDRLSREYRDAVGALGRLDDQGDGVRAFVGIAVQVMAGDVDIVLLDEPEAFLHPPQATMLGRFLAEQTPSDKQLIVATHSTDVLRGIMDAKADQRVRVLRLERAGAINKTTELQPDDLRQVWKDPLLRYSRVLDGVFHEAVVVCEADSDCRFYEAMLAGVESSERTPDIAWVQGGGKDRIPHIATALRAVGVPVRAVADFDVLREEAGIRKIVEALGGDWLTLAKDYVIVSAAVSDKKPELAVAQVKVRVDAVLSSIAGANMSDAAIKDVREIAKRASPWGEAKVSGKAFIPSGAPSQAFERLSKALRDMGLFVVEVGELEGFCKTVPNHGPAWVTQVLEQYQPSDPHLREAREFVAALAAGWSRPSALG